MTPPFSYRSKPHTPSAADLTPVNIAIVLLATCFASVTPRLGAQTPDPATQPAAAPAAKVSTTSPAQPAATEPTVTAFTGLTDGWFGARQKLADRGITFDISLTADGTKNLQGGIDTAGSAWRVLFDPSMTIDLKPLAGIEGGTVYAEFQYAQGPNASDKLVGDLQGVDNLDGVPGAHHQNSTQLAAFWYQQTAFDGLLRFKIGKSDANYEFDHSAFAQEFLQQSYGSSATLFTLPTYPDPAFGLDIFVKPTKETQIGFGVYDGSLANGVATGAMGPSTFFKSHDLFFIGEIDQSWKLGPDQLAGRFGVGGWYSTNTFRKLEGGETAGTGGPYVLVDQAVWRANPTDDHDTRGIGLFVMWGMAEAAIVQFDHNVGGGVTWTGPLDKRPNDILGTGIQAVHFSDDFHAHADFEVNYELFYRLQLTPWFAVKPDFQYVVNPGGKGARDAVVFTLRFQMSF